MYALKKEVRVMRRKRKETYNGAHELQLRLSDFSLVSGVLRYEDRNRHLNNMEKEAKELALWGYNFVAFSTLALSPYIMLYEASKYL